MKLFKVTLQDISLLRDSLDAVSSMITEATFEVSKDGLKLVAMDPASVAMVVLKILPSAFLEYSCKEESRMTISLGNLVTILKRARGNDQIVFELTENKLKVLMKGDFKRTFVIPLIDSTATVQKVPELTFKSKVILSADALKDGIKDAQMISDCVILEANPLSFMIKSFGDTSETDMVLTKDSPSLNTLSIAGETSEANKTIKSKYSIDYIDKMLKGMRVADSITLQFSSDYPMKLDYTVVDKLQLSFILAPRVDTD
jgi:proliferating cell nuclear antigen